MRYRVTHTTNYDYSEPVRRAYSQARLIPRTRDGQQCIRHALKIFPRAEDYREREDYFGNRTAYFNLQTPHDTLTVTATSEVEVTVPAPDLAVYPPGSWDRARDELQQATPVEVEAFDLSLPTPATQADAAIVAYAGHSFIPGRGLVEAVTELMYRIHEDFTYQSGVTSVSTPLTQVMAERTGVCQDFAHLLVACLRSRRLPARYVSGYLETIPPPGQEKLRGADASHAWAAALVPGYGWLDLDPTNGQIPDGRYITTAWGRDYFDVAPLQGVLFGGGKHQLSVSVDMEQVGS